MEDIRIKAYAKINLSLRILGKRPDGYHELYSVMQQIGLYDELYLRRLPEGIVLKVESDAAPGCGHENVPADESNIAWKAARLFFEERGIAGGVEIQLKKHIPAAAGLAGGSTDAAAVLKGLSRLYESGDSEESLCETGVRLGADVPFCIRGGTMLAEGIGEKLSPLPAPQGYTVLLVKPPVDVPTGEVYRAFDALAPHCPEADMVRILKEEEKRPLTEGLYNDLAAVTEAKHMRIAALRKELCAEGACGALMSGSGPTVFGLYAEAEQAERVLRKMKESHPDCFCGIYEFMNL